MAVVIVASAARSRWRGSLGQRSGEHTRTAWGCDRPRMPPDTDSKACRFSKKFSEVSCMAVTAETVHFRTDDPLVIAGRTCSSRLLVGTGKYKDLDETRRAVEASGAQIITIAVPRPQNGKAH